MRKVRRALAFSCSYVSDHIPNSKSLWSAEASILLDVNLKIDQRNRTHLKPLHTPPFYVAHPMSFDNSTITIPDDHWVDAINLVSSTTVASTAYGIMFTLYLICCYFLRLQITNKQGERRSVFLICYITAMFVFGTIYVATTTQATMDSYVYHANFPGGPSAYNNLVLFSAPIGIINTVSYVLANWLADAMLVSSNLCRR
jgi:hypothetical protein